MFNNKEPDDIWAIYSSMQHAAGYGNRRIFEILYKPSLDLFHIADFPHTNPSALPMQERSTAYTGLIMPHYNAPQSTLFYRLFYGYQNHIEENKVPEKGLNLWKKALSPLSIR